MFKTLFKKELREQFRTSKFLILVLVLFVTGMISPLLAKYTPVILRAIPDVPEGLLGAIPDPTVVDSISQYIKNMTQFGVLLVVLFGMSAIAQEKERGTAAMLLVKPVNRTTVVLAKWAAALVTIVSGVVVAGAAEMLYTYILFDSTFVLSGFLGLNILLVLFFVVYQTAALAASSIARSQGMAGLLAFALLAVLLILSSIPWVKEVMPSAMLNWAAGASLGFPGEAMWGSVIGSILLTVFFLFIASFKFQRDEI